MGGRAISRVAQLSVMALGGLVMAGCETLIDIDTHSSFFSPASAGSVPIGSGTILLSGDVSTETLGGVQYYLTRGSNGVHGYSGIFAGSDTGDAVTTGEAAYLADYEVATLTNLKRAGGTVSGFIGTDSGVILLAADFDSATLTGEDGNLVVNGMINGETLRGTVRYSGEQGILRGQIGEFGTIGAFHGNSGTIVYAGGFAAEVP